MRSNEEAAVYTERFVGYVFGQRKTWRTEEDLL